MIKVEVITNFKIKEYNKIYNIFRMDSNQPHNRLIEGDTFYCDEEMCRHLLGEDDNNPVVRVIEIIKDDEIKSEN